MKRIEDTAERDRFANELDDRYGALPRPALMLLAPHRLALEARDQAIARIQVRSGGMAFTDRGDVTLHPGAGRHEVNGRIIANRHEHLSLLDDAARAFKIMASADGVTPAAVAVPSRFA